MRNMWVHGGEGCICENPRGVPQRSVLPGLCTCNTRSATSRPGAGNTRSVTTANAYSTTQPTGPLGGIASLLELLPSPNPNLNPNPNPNANPNPHPKPHPNPNPKSQTPSNRVRSPDRRSKFDLTLTLTLTLGDIASLPEPLSTTRLACC